MSSGGHRGFTVVTIITLIFAPFFTHHEWVYKLVGETHKTQIVQCAPKQPCPATRTVVNIVREPIPTGGGDHGGGDQGGGGDKGGKGGGGDQGGKGGNGAGWQGGRRRPRWQGQALTPLMLLVSGVLVAFDFQNLLSWWHGRLIKPGQARHHGLHDRGAAVRPSSLLRRPQPDRVLPGQCPRRARGDSGSHGNLRR